MVPVVEYDFAILPFTYESSLGTFNLLQGRHCVCGRLPISRYRGLAGVQSPIVGTASPSRRSSDLTYILSTAPWDNPSAWTDKLLWVQKYMGQAAYKRLILSHRKNLNLGDYLIDDRVHNGAGEFTGEHIHFRTERFKNWDAVLDYLL